MDPLTAVHGQRTLAAIVLTDAVGFSARMAAAEEATLRLIHQDLKLIETLCEQFEGHVIKSTGDGLLMYFMSAVQAVTCSLEIQRQLASTHNQYPADEPLLHRIGVHLGDVFFKDADVMGNGVNIAARLQTEAEPGGVCISQIVHDVVKSRLTLNATFAGNLQLKNIQDPQPAYHLNPYDDRPVGAPSDPSQAVPSAQAAPPRSPTATDTPIPTTRTSLPPGSKVGGRYLIQRVLGQGGFGRSYLVEDSQRFGEWCVLKEFFPVTSNSHRNLQKALDLFKREAKTLYQINHPQIPQFMACFTQGERLFIVQEYVNGVTYDQLLRERKREGRRFSPEEIVQWLIHMLQVLDYLHHLNIVHRDISPDNIMYSSDRNLPILIDFGLVNDAMNSILSGATELDDEDATVADRRRAPATIVGKFGYSPPEQIQLGQCYPSSDLYALGITAIVLLTGKSPRELMNRDSLEWDWQRHVSLPTALVQLLNKLIQPRPSDRFQSAKEVLAQAIALVPNAASPLPQPTNKPIDWSLDSVAAPLFDAPLEPGRSVTRDPAFITQCQQELTRSIGPMATVLIEDVLEQHPNASPQELVTLLAAQLSDGRQAEAFTTRIYAESGLLARSGLSGEMTDTQAAATTMPQRSDPINPDFVQRCRQALVHSIGPMADFLLEETLADFPDLNPQGLVLKLAAEIPNAEKAKEFQRQLL